MPYALDDHGQPLVLISAMAMHTQNLQADPRASLLVTQPVGGPQGREPSDPLAAARLTVMGEARTLARGEVGTAREAYLARHPRAAYWVDFEDFSFWRLEVRDVYFVGGFAAMDWVTADDYRAARPDPLADAAAGILDHMNRDHADALIAYARHFAGEPADEATMIAVDRLGFRLRIRTGERLHGVRIAFPREVRTASESRTVLIEMLDQARVGS
jgi:heme oxygenase (biliverdin-IX-beta and delta-forming)